MPNRSLLRRCAAPLVLAGVAGGCRSSEPICTPDAVAHVLLETAHPWHSGPALVVTGAVFLPLGIAAAPLILLDPGGNNTHMNSTFQAVLMISMVPGVIVGSAFYVALYPLEWAFPVPEPADVGTPDAPWRLPPAAPAPTPDSVGP